MKKYFLSSVAAICVTAMAFSTTGNHNNSNIYRSSLTDTLPSQSTQTDGSNNGNSGVQNQSNSGSRNGNSRMHSNSMNRSNSNGKNAKGMHHKNANNSGTGTNRQRDSL